MWRLQQARFPALQSRIILESVDKYTDHFRWSRIAALLPGRTALSVKHHYERKLMPSLKKACVPVLGMSWHTLAMVANMLFVSTGAIYSGGKETGTRSSPNTR